MQNLNITSAIYIPNKDITGTVLDGYNSIKAIIDGITMSVPLDPANRHYAEIMRQVETGELVIEPADTPE